MANALIDTASAAHDVSLESLTAAVLRGKRHQGGLKMWPCLRLDPAWFAEITGEVAHLARDRIPSETARPDHPGNWVGVVGHATQHSLFNVSGDTSDYGADFNSEAAGKSFVGPEYPAMARLVACFAERLHNFRLNTLHPGAALKPHEEPIVRDDLICLRFHLPVQTNAAANIVLDGEQFHFEPGVIYFFNKGCVHSAENQGATPRVHFLWDLWLDQWVFATMFDATRAQTPGAGLERIDPVHASELCHSTPVEVNEYILGTASGAVLRARRDTQTAALTREALNFNPDVVPTDESITLSGEWHPLEHWAGDTFRWVGGNGAFNVLALEDGMQRIQIELEPGPGVAALPMDLQAVDRDGCELVRLTVQGRETLELAVPVHAGPVNRFRLVARNGGRQVATDPRLLDFRVFRIARLEDA